MKKMTCFPYGSHYSDHKESGDANREALECDAVLDKLLLR